MRRGGVVVVSRVPRLPARRLALSAIDVVDDERTPWRRQRAAAAACSRRKAVEKPVGLSCGRPDRAAPAEEWPARRGAAGRLHRQDCVTAVEAPKLILRPASRACKKRSVNTGLTPGRKPLASADCCSSATRTARRDVRRLLSGWRRRSRPGAASSRIMLAGFQEQPGGGSYRFPVEGIDDLGVLWVPVISTNWRRRRPVAGVFPGLGGSSLFVAFPRRASAGGALVIAWRDCVVCGSSSAQAAIMSAGCVCRRRGCMSAPDRGRAEISGSRRESGIVVRDFPRAAVSMAKRSWKAADNRHVLEQGRAWSATQSDPRSLHIPRHRSNSALSASGDYRAGWRAHAGQQP